MGKGLNVLIRIYVLLNRSWGCGLQVFPTPLYSLQIDTSLSYKKGKKFQSDHPEESLA